MNMYIKEAHRHSILFLHNLISRFQVVTSALASSSLHFNPSGCTAMIFQQGLTCLWRSKATSFVT